MAARSQHGVRLNVLFIGNSFTARNDLPGLVARLAAARGHTLVHRLISAGGASLRTHWNAGKAIAMISEGRYDGVVLQEQSTLPVKNAARMSENIVLFDDAIKAAGSRTILYQTWARKHAPKTQTHITDAYETIGRNLRATVVPVGRAWEQFLRAHDEPALHDRDQSHPTVAGSYLAACCFCAILFGENPVGINDDIDGVPACGRAVLQKAAWQVCRSAMHRSGR
jgi:hypothetical protein